MTSPTKFCHNKILFLLQIQQYDPEIILPHPVFFIGGTFKPAFGGFLHVSFIDGVN